jgi:enoyl-CoA hydratase
VTDQPLIPTLRLDRHADGVFVLTFNRPELRNALDLATMRAFRGLIHDLAAQSDLRALILTGAGDKAFCSGGDLAELSNYRSEDDARDFINTMGDALLVLERLPVPVIAAINGYALGGGSEVALTCDLRLADATAQMGFVHIRNALTPGWGAGQRLLRLVGYSRAIDLLLSGRVMNADEAHALGLVNRVTAAGSALEAALTWAHEIAGGPPGVVRAVKALLQAGLNHPYEDALRIERDLFPPLWAADAHVQAVETFLRRQR